MKAFKLLLVWVLFLNPFGSEQAKAADSYKVDAGHTSVLFGIKHLNVSMFYGRFNESEGTIVYDAANPGNSSVEFRIKSESVDTFNEKRDKHIKGPDFFNAKQFPVIEFRSEKVKKLKDGRLEVSGKMSFLGITKPLTVVLVKTGEGKDPWGGYRIGFETKFSFKRSDFGMNYMLKGLSDEIQMTVSIEGIKK